MNKIELRVEFDNVTELHVSAERFAEPLRWKQDYDYLRDNSDSFGTIQEILIDESDDKWFLFWVEDCYTPPIYLVSADSLDTAYEIFIDYAAEKCHLKIETEDLSDYGVVDDNYDDYSGNSTGDGVPVDTESVNGTECRLIRVVQE